MVEDSVAAGDDEADGRHLRTARGEVCFKDYGVDVAFEVIYGDKRLAEREGENFAVGQADEEGACEAGTLGDGDGVEIGEGDFCLVERFADDWDDFAEMLARGELGNYAAVFAVDIDLRGDDAREDAAAVGDDCCGGFVAGGFDAEDQPFARVQCNSFLRSYQLIIVTYRIPWLSRVRELR
jgi:hypothetical protein